MRYYGQWNPPVDRVLFENFFKEKYGGVLVECGAGDGLTESCGKFFAERGWTCVNVEPDGETFRRLCHNRPGERNWNMALSDKDSDDGLTFVRGPHADQTTVSPCRTWKSMVDHFKLTRVDLFVLDVEGHELAVVEGMRNAAVLPDVICAEYPWPTTGLDPLTAALTPLGYRRLFLSFNNAFFARDPRPGPFFGETREYQPGELG